MEEHTFVFRFHAFGERIFQQPEQIFWIGLVQNHQFLQFWNSSNFELMQSSYHDEPDRGKLIEKDSRVMA